MATDGNEPFWLFVGVVAIMAAFALVRGARRRSRPGAPRWGRGGGDGWGRGGGDAGRGKPARTDPSGRWENDSSRGPGSTDGGASDNAGSEADRG